MRTLPLLLLLVAITVTSKAIAAGPTDGFRGFRWGSEPTRSMYQVEKKANMLGYMVHEEDRTVLGVEADFITYYYFGGGLCRVQVTWWPRERALLNQLQASLEKAWGKPTKSDGTGGARIIEWVSESGLTSGSLLAMDDAKNDGKSFIDIVIQGRECSNSAIEGRGL